MSAFDNPPKMRYFIVRSLGSKVKLAVELTPTENIARFHSSAESSAHYHKKAVGKGDTAEKAVAQWHEDVKKRAHYGEH